MTDNLANCDATGHPRPYLTCYSTWATIGPSSEAVQHTLQTWLVFANADDFVSASTATIARSLCYPDHVRQAHNIALVYSGHLRRERGGFHVSRVSTFYRSTGTDE